MSGGDDISRETVQGEARPPAAAGRASDVPERALLLPPRAVEIRKCGLVSRLQHQREDRFKARGIPEVRWETRQERRVRLVKAGVWGSFTDFRERLLRAGVKQVVAARISGWMYAPGAGPMPTGDRMVEAADEMVKVLEAGGDVMAAIERVRGGPVGPGREVGGLPATKKSLPEMAHGAGARAKKRGRPPQVKREVGEAAAQTTAAGVPVSPVEGAVVGTAAPLAAESPTKPTLTALAPGVDPAYLRLVVAGQAAEGKRASQRQEVEWVMANLLVPLELISAEGVPSTAAVSLLAWARETASNRAEFVVKHYGKIIPTKGPEEDGAVRFTDDDRRIGELLAEFDRQVGRTAESEVCDAQDAGVLPGAEGH